jgi:hypothetical protein
MKDI